MAFKNFNSLPNNFVLNNNTIVDFQSQQTIANNTVAPISASTTSTTYKNILPNSIWSTADAQYTAIQPGMYTSSFDMNWGIIEATGPYYSYVTKVDNTKSLSTGPISTTIAEKYDLVTSTAAYNFHQSASGQCYLYEGDNLIFNTFQDTGAGITGTSMHASVNLQH